MAGLLHGRACCSWLKTRGKEQEVRASGFLSGFAYFVLVSVTSVRATYGSLKLS